MDEQSQKMLDAVLAKEPGELTENDKALLRARMHYVGKKSREKFADVLSEQSKDTTQTEEEPETEKKNDESQQSADTTEDEEADESGN